MRLLTFIYYVKPLQSTLLREDFSECAPRPRQLLTKHTVFQYPKTHAAHTGRALPQRARATPPDAPYLGRITLPQQGAKHTKTSRSCVLQPRDVLPTSPHPPNPSPTPLKTSPKLGRYAGAVSRSLVLLNRFLLTLAYLLSLKNIYDVKATNTMN